MKWNIIISDLILVDWSIHHKLEKYVRHFWRPKFECICKVMSPERHGRLLGEETGKSVSWSRFNQWLLLLLWKKIAAACIMLGVCTCIQEVREQGTFLRIHGPLYRPWAWVQALVSSMWRDCSLLVTMGDLRNDSCAFADRMIRWAATYFEILNNVFAPRKLW